MNTQRFLMAGVLVALLAALGGCSEPPILEEKEAEEAILQARDLAEIYAPDEMEAAFKAFDEGKLQIEAQATSSEMGRSYSKAKQLMIEAKAAAERAGQAARENQESARQDAEAKLAEVEAGIEEAREALGSARRTRSNRSARTRLGAELDGMTASLQGARDMLAVDTYLEVAQMAEELKGRIEEIKTGISEL